MEIEHTIRRYKGFEIHPSPHNRGNCVKWQVRWHDMADNACSLAQECPSIAAAKRAINECIKSGVRPKQVQRNRPIYMPFTSRRIG